MDYRAPTGDHKTVSYFLSNINPIQKCSVIYIHHIFILRCSNLSCIYLGLFSSGNLFNYIQLPFATVVFNVHLDDVSPPLMNVYQTGAHQNIKYWWGQVILRQNDGLKCMQIGYSIVILKRSNRTHVQYGDSNVNIV